MKPRSGSLAALCAYVGHGITAEYAAGVLRRRRDCVQRHLRDLERSGFLRLQRRMRVPGRHIAVKVYEVAP